MALEHITAEQLRANGMVSVPDVMSGTAAENKQRFDKLVAEVVAPAYNACVDAVNAIEEGERSMQEAEKNRVNEEGSRAQNEGDRQTAEEFRVREEEERAKNERVRIEAELARADAEKKREEKEAGYVARSEAGALRAETAAKRAESAAGSYPYIGENGNWHVLNEDTGVAATEKGDAYVLTNADKQEITGYVLAALPTYNGEVEDA